MFSDKIEEVIQQAILEYDGNVDMPDNSFRTLLSMGELVDRLSIINFKLYKLKDEVYLSDNVNFKSWASTEDIKLCEERSRLKKCIDEKLIEFVSGKNKFNSETKKYGIVKE